MSDFENKRTAWLRRLDTAVLATIVLACGFWIALLIYLGGKLGWHMTRQMWLGG